MPVSLATGPSAPRNDVTDASGTVMFAGLTPNPTSGGQAYYDLSLTPPTGYVTLYDTVSPAAPAHVQLSPGQTWPTALYIYKPATIYVDLRNFDGTPYTGSGTTATVSYTRNSTLYSKAFRYPGSTLSVTSMTEGTQTVQLIPGLSYTVSVLGGTFYYKDTTVSPQNSGTANVPDGYPNVLTHTFTFTNAELATVRSRVSGPAAHEALQERDGDDHRRAVRRCAVELHDLRHDHVHRRPGRRSPTFRSGRATRSPATRT